MHKDAEGNTGDSTSGNLGETGENNDRTCEEENDSHTRGENNEITQGKQTFAAIIYHFECCVSLNDSSLTGNKQTVQYESWISSPVSC